MTADTTQVATSSYTKASQTIIAVLVVIVIALAGGAILLTGGMEQTPRGLTFSVIAAMLAGVAMVMRLFMGNVAEQTAASGPDVEEEDLPEQTDELRKVFHKQLIVGALMLEGAALVNLFAYMQERNWWSLTIAFVVAMAIAAIFPTQEKIDRWIETRQRRKS